MHHDSVLSILSVWRISVVYQTPCLCSVGFLNRSDKGSDTAFRFQGQRTVHLRAALQVCIGQKFHCCQGDRIPLDFALVHQRLRGCTDEAHVDSEAEAKVLVLCIVSVERRLFAQASQVLEQFGMKRFRHSRSTCRYRTSSWIRGFNEPAPLPCMSVNALVSENTIDSRPVRSRVHEESNCVLYN